MRKKVVGPGFEYQTPVDPKDVEIERMTEQAIKFRDLCVEKDQLITELADALEEEFGMAPDLVSKRPWNLIQRARLVVK